MYKKFGECEKAALDSACRFGKKFFEIPMYVKPAVAWFRWRIILLSMERTIKVLQKSPQSL
jgi:hypothetical protein